MTGVSGELLRNCVYLVAIRMLKHLPLRDETCYVFSVQSGPHTAHSGRGVGRYPRGQGFDITLLGVPEPHLDGYLEEGCVEEVPEVPRDCLGRYGLHFLDDLISVLVQELVHSLS